MVQKNRRCNSDLIAFHPLVILFLLSPLIAVLSLAILLGLLGIFVTWLIVVTILLFAIVGFDLLRGSIRHLFRPIGTLQRRPVG